MNLLLIGHACGPNLGSEPGFTWNWAQSLSRRHRVWLITHPERRADVEAYLKKNPNPNLTFVWVDVPGWMNPWKPSRGERGIKLHYFLWLSLAYKKARQLCRTVRFDVSHHISWGTIGAAPPFWQLPVPSFWGPLGGGQSTPPSFLNYFGRKKWVETLRSAYVFALGFSPAFLRAAKTARVVFATNRETEKSLQKAGARDVRLLLDCGLPGGFVPDTLAERLASEELHLFWAGRLEARKGLDLGLEALALIPNLPVKLTVAGKGNLDDYYRQRTAELGLQDRVTFLGSVSYREMPQLFRSSDAFLFTSLRDSFGSVVLEAMAYGLPVITLDHQGVGAFVPTAAAMKVAVTNPEDTASGLAQAIARFYREKHHWRDMQTAAWRFASDQTWDRRADKMTEVYEEVLRAS
jgi:glycosyltransferase involved in cell wall biosynthesis